MPVVVDVISDMNAVSEHEFVSEPFNVSATIAKIIGNDYYDHCDYLEVRAMDKDTWTVAEAKAHLSEVLELAQSAGPQTITRRGQVAAVIVSPEEWQRKTHRTGNLAEFFAASPLRGAELQVARSKDHPRKVDL
jgi:prevent-host-death family protein